MKIMQLSWPDPGVLHGHRAIVSGHQEPAAGARLGDDAFAHRQTPGGAAVDRAPGCIRAAADRRRRQDAAIGVTVHQHLPQHPPRDLGVDARASVSRRTNRMAQSTHALGGDPAIEGASSKRLRTSMKNAGKPQGKPQGLSLIIPASGGDLAKYCRM